MRIALALLLLLVMGIAPARAQIVIDVPGRADLPLAVPSPQTPSGDPGGLGDEIGATLRRDLDLSGYFQLIDPAAYIEQNGGVEPGTFSFDDWTLLKAAVLVKTRVLPAGDPQCDPGGNKMCADAFVYYVVSGEPLLTKRYRSEPGNARHVAHRIASAVVEAVTGRAGFFGARIAAVGAQTGNKEIYVMDVDGKGVVPVTRNGSINLSPDLSPNGRQLAWTSYRKSNPDIYVKDLVTGRTRVISNQRGVNLSPAFSPDSRLLAVARTAEHDSDIFLLDARTGQVVKQVTQGGGIDVSPQFLPDGQRLVFASERSGGSQVYLANLRDGSVERITFHGDYNADPVVSPDGTEVAFVSREEGGFDIYVAQLDGRNVRRLTQDTGDNEDPSWSGDGKYLIFSSTRTGRSEIWLTTADGRHQMPLTRSGGWTQPTWVH